VASGATTASALPYPTKEDGFSNSGDMQRLAAALDSKVVMTFANAQDRDAKAGSVQDGAWCYLREVPRYMPQYMTYKATAGGWTWPSWSHGLIALAEYVETDNTPPRPGRTPLANDLTGLPAFNVSVPFIPAGRRIKMWFRGSMSADQRETGYQFFMIFAGVQQRISIPMIVADIPHSFYFPHYLTTPTTYTGMTGGILQGGRLFGPGQCFLNTTSYDGPTQFGVEDLGAA
jgi:hypothetical protein